MAEQVVCVIAQPPQKFSASDDFALWFKKVQPVPRGSRGPKREKSKGIASLHDNTAFHVVGQLGLLKTDNYDALKQADSPVK